MIRKTKKFKSDTTKKEREILNFNSELHFSDE
jgi:hypothetical protein